MITNSLKKTISIINKNRKKILLLFLLQVIFFIVLSLVFYQNVNPAMEHARNVVEYYDEINMSENSMFGYLGDEPSVVYENYRGMMGYLRLMGLFSFLAFTVINGLLWDFSDGLVKKKNRKEFVRYFLNFIALSLIFAGLYILVFNVIKSSLVTMESSQIAGILFLFIALSYFLFLSYSLIDKRKIKDVLRLTFFVGSKRFPYVILVYLFNLSVILSFSYLLYLVVEASMVILAILAILFVFAFVFNRLLLMVCVNELCKKL